MDQVKVNTVRKGVYVALGNQTGLTDLVVTVYKPDGSIFSPAPTVTELTDGAYEYSYTPDVTGIWREVIQSATNGDDQLKGINVVNVDLSDIESNQQTIETKVDNIQVRSGGYFL